MPAPLVSIIIPCYNSTAWIAETIESALAQTWERKEIIVVNDGSTDDSLDVVRSYEGKGIRIISQANRGVCSARNVGYQASSGEYIQLLDADDLLSPDKIERQVALLENELPGTLSASRWGFFRKDPTRTQFAPSPLWRDFSPENYLKVSAGAGVYFIVHSWLIPRNLAEAAGPFNEELTSMEDVEYFTRLVLKAKKIRFCEQGRCHYRTFHAQSVTKTRTRQLTQSLVQATMLIEQHLLGRDSPAQLRQVPADLFQRLVYMTYPDHPDLIAFAERRISELGGSNIPLPMGRHATALANVVGWKAVQRLRAWLWSRGVYLGKRNNVSD